MIVVENSHEVGCLSIRSIFVPECFFLRFVVLGDLTHLARAIIRAKAFRSAGVVLAHRILAMSEAVGFVPISAGRLGVDTSMRKVFYACVCETILRGTGG